jgi:sulfite reductase beta subunit-like hemoprotein
MECDADLRFAPWRGMVLGSVPKHLASRVVAALETVALRCDGQNGFQGIAACAGNTGCDAALADVRGDAAALARQLAGKDLSSGWTVNFSGCEKQCAMRQGASAELIAHSDGYMLRLDGQLATSIYSPESALQAILSARSQCGSISEVVS